MKEYFYENHMRRLKTITYLACILLLGTGSAYAQSQNIPDEYDGVVLRGNYNTIARGVLDGNLIETNFRNHGELARWGDIPWGVWPRGTNARHIDGVGAVVAGYVNGADADRITSFEDYIHYIENNMIPDTLLNPVIINYRDAGVRLSPYSGNVWGWLPLPGFNNPERRDSVSGIFEPTPALSDDETSWPLYWPDRLEEEDMGWPGTWNGRDGRFASADLESYYVMDDFSDLEYAFGIETDDPDDDTDVPTPHSPLGVYYPSPYSDPTMGGFGLQTQVRVFQWANILAEDTMFLIYRITNKGDFTQKRLYFVQIVDYGIGEDENDDWANYDPILDVVYGWDDSGIAEGYQGGPDYVTGYTGFAFLESPANDNNNIDDDQDGIIDESRFDENYIMLEGQLAITNHVVNNYDLDAFENFYETDLEDRPAYQRGVWFTTDENLDWVGFTDDNGNGIHDVGEVLNNDVGRDGLGVFDLNYPGPDEGEGDGLPTNGEPNYNELDVDESDQIGLTGIDINTRPFYESGNNLRDDTWLFERIRVNLFPDPDVIPPVDGVRNDEPFLLFASGEVELASQDIPNGKSTDFFSTAWIFGDDEQDFFKNRRTVQNIYNADYNFAQPPIAPTLKAVAGDERVVLSWDTLSIRSYDRFLQDFDFEGYRVYKATNNIFADARTITDINGTPTFYEPIAQYDLVNDISGPVTVLEGEAVYHMGDNTGLAFNYVDTDVINGKAYYYAVVAYDRGIFPEEGSGAPGIDPQENTFRVAVNLSGEVTGVSKNAAVVVPTTPPAGYVSGGATVDLSKVTGGTATGSAEVNIVSELELRDEYQYRVNFFDSASTTGDYRLTSGFTMKELTNDSVIIARKEFTTSTTVIDGFTFNMANDEPGDVIENKSGYIINEGGENELYNFNPNELDGVSTDWVIDIDNSIDGAESNAFYATDKSYEIEFVDPNDSMYTPPRYLSLTFSRVDIPAFARNRSTGELVDMLVADNDDSDDLSPGDQIVITENTGPRVYQHRFTVSFLFGTAGNLPAPGQKIVISSTRQFGSDDFFEFGVKKGAIDDDLAKSELENIKVIPNPYVGAASWERYSGSLGRGERKIEFVNLPRKCTIRIFNVRGELIKTLEHDGAFNDGSEPWDLRTNNNEDVAYGVYFYHVTAEGIGEYVNKFAIVK